MNEEERDAKGGAVDFVVEGAVVGEGEDLVAGLVGIGFEDGGEVCGL